MPLLAESSSRFREVAEMLKHLRDIEPDRPRFSEQFRVLKGLFFVQLYAAYEFTVNATVEDALTRIQALSRPVKDISLPLLALELDALFRSVADTFHVNNWTKRMDLLGKIGSSDDPTMSVSPLSPILMNPNANVLRAIWRLFCVRENLFKEAKWIGRVNELCDNRNKVAHGRESATAVGGAFSVSDLDTQYADINAFCLHFSDALSKGIDDGCHMRQQ